LLEKGRGAKPPQKRWSVAREEKQPLLSEREKTHRGEKKIAANGFAERRRHFASSKRGGRKKKGAPHPPPPPGQKDINKKTERGANDAELEKQRERRSGRKKRRTFFPIPKKKPFGKGCQAESGVGGPTVKEGGEGGADLKKNRQKIMCASGFLRTGGKERVIR